MFLIVLLVSYALWHIINAVIVNDIFFFLTLVSALYPQYLAVKYSEYRLSSKREEGESC